MLIEPTLNKSHLKHSGKILASALFLSKELIFVGNTPIKINSYIHKYILSFGAVPSFLKLNGFPSAACISVNHQVVHGVPSNIPLKEGDLVTIDIGVSYKKHCTDAARTFVVGKSNKKKDTLIKTANLALNDGISKAMIGNTVGDISFAIQRVVEKNGFRSPLNIGGHGIGTKPHLSPYISNTGFPGKGEKLIEGMCLAIEPIVMSGKIDLFLDKDNFTLCSKDYKISSHSEDTIIITKDLPIILTRNTFNGDYV